MNLFEEQRLDFEFFAFRSARYVLTLKFFSSDESDKWHLSDSSLEESIMLSYALCIIQEHYALE